MPREPFINEIPRTWQLKERAGFLVSRSLKLPSAPPGAESVTRDLTGTSKKEKHGATHYLRSLDGSKWPLGNPSHRIKTIISIQASQSLSYRLFIPYRFYEKILITQTHTFCCVYDYCTTFYIKDLRHRRRL